MNDSKLDDENTRWGLLMSKAQNGDKEALRTLYGEISPVILGFCYNRAGHLGIPEDTLQESLIAIHKNRHVYIPERSFKAWMFSIVRSKLIDQLRKQTRIEKIDKAVASATDSFTHSDIEGKTKDGHGSENEQIEKLRKALSSLPKKYSTALRLVKLEGLSIKQAADSEGISESAFKLRVHRGYKMLVEKIL